VRTVVLDSGAFLAAERNSRQLVNHLTVAAKRGSVVLVPATVVAEVWRDPVRHRSVSLLKATDAVIPLGLRDSQAVGRLLGVDRSSQIVDANVALTAFAARPSLVLTSDPQDVARLICAAGGTCSVDGKGAATADVAIETI